MLLSVVNTTAQITDADNKQAVANNNNQTMKYREHTLIQETSQTKQRNAHTLQRHIGERVAFFFKKRKRESHTHTHCNEPLTNRTNCTNKLRSCLVKYQCCKYTAAKVLKYCLSRKETNIATKRWRNNCDATKRWRTP